MTQRTTTAPRPATHEPWCDSHYTGTHPDDSECRTTRTPAARGVTYMSFDDYLGAPLITILADDELTLAQTREYALNLLALVARGVAA